MGLRFHAGIAAIALSLAGCATQPKLLAEGLPSLPSGLFHGFFIVFSLFASAFSSTKIYEFPNDGFAYDLGFTLGALASCYLLIRLSIAFPKFWKRTTRLNDTAQD